MKRQVYISKYKNLFAPENNFRYGDQGQCALLFEDINPWPNPEKEDYFYIPKYKDYKFDKEFLYVVNDLEMRSPKFKKNVTVIATGCSNTFGVGLPEEVLWPKLIAEKYNVDFVNLAQPGTSPELQIINIFQYCKTFGNPKIILCVFPNFERTRVFADNKVIKTRKETPSIGLYDIHADILDSRPSYVQLPTLGENIISDSHAFAKNLTAIFMLEQYCKSNNIKLIWTSWSHINFSTAFSYFFDNYIINKSPGYPENLSTCNLHLDIKEKYSDIYDVGADRQKHWGAHWHTHTAEAFIDEIKRLEILL